MKKITFLTGHNWKSNRLGGFHKFAEEAVNQGIDVVFFSFPRPYYSYFQHQELYNKKTIKQLQKGIVYNYEKATLKNVTFSTFKLPNFFNKFFSDSAMNAFERFSIKSFKKFALENFSNTDVFVFESCDGMIFLKKLKKLFPNAKFVYRPSDPLMFDGCLIRYYKNEKYMILNADLNIIVNQEGLNLYKRKIPDFEKTVKYTLLSNGVDIESYQKKYPIPELLQRPNTFLYVGAWEVEWNLLFESAKTLPDFNFIIVCPNYPEESIVQNIKNYSNLFYVPGIKPQEVPAWITNCSVVIVPYVTDFYKNRPLGITAKYYQAMAAGKPIVAYCDTPKLKDEGISVTYTYKDFIEECKKSIEIKSKAYNFDLKDRQWSNITKKFMELLNGLE